MIHLNLQIKLIIFSFIFGFLFSIVMDILYLYLKNKNKLYSLLLSFCLICFMTIIYFAGIKQIGYIIFHFYSILVIVLGFITYDIILKIIAKYSKK